MRRAIFLRRHALSPEMVNLRVIYESNINVIFNFQFVCLAFQDAIKAIRFNSKPVNKSSHLLLQMMQDNLAMWSSKHSKVSEIVSMPGKTESKKETKLAEEKKVNIHRSSRPIADFSKLA